MTRRPSTSSSAAGVAPRPAAPGTRNEVVLVGRVAAAPLERLLPSGDSLLTARVIVDRDASAQQHSSQRVDTIDCVAWTVRVQRSMRAWSPGDLVEVAGSIRRRFFRGISGPVSRVEVEIKQTKRVKAVQR